MKKRIKLYELDRKSADLSAGVYRSMLCTAEHYLGMGSKGKKSCRGSVPRGSVVCTNNLLAQALQCEMH